MDKKRYDCKEAEPRILKFWEDKGIFKFDPEAKGPVYSVDTPPPTVSGKMHIGHAFQYTQFDIIARYKRLNGFNVFMPFGTPDMYKEIRNLADAVRFYIPDTLAKVATGTPLNNMDRKWINDALNQDKKVFERLKDRGCSYVA